MTLRKTAALLLVLIGLAAGSARAEDKATAQTPPASDKPTININMDPKLSAAETAYGQKFATLTPEQQEILKTSETDNIKAIDLDMQALKALYEVKYCGEKDPSFAKGIEKYKAEAGIYTNGLQTQSMTARKLLREKRMADTTAFIDQQLVDGHNGFMTVIATSMFGQMTKMSYEKRGFVKTDCAGLAKKLDSAFAAANAQTPATMDAPAGRAAQIEAAAAKGDRESIVTLGMMKISGQGIDKDVTGGMEILTRAAESGYSRAQYMLGLVYGTDISGMPPDKEKAKAWLAKAAAQGDKKAQAMLDNPDAMKTPEDAGTLRRKADAGDAGAAYELGTRYSLGIGGVTKSADEAMKWKLQAAGQGHPLAQSDIGSMLMNNQKYDEGLTWITKAATQGHVNSQYQLGLIYAQGLGVTKDLPQAKFWVKKAADAGDARAIDLIKKLDGK